MRKLLLLLFITSLGCVTGTKAQELQAKVSIASAAVGSQVDKKIFQTLQTALTNFLNNRRWTNETWQPNEKIVCNFLLNISGANNNVFQSTLTVQAARPVYNSSYESPLINFIDNDLTFRYIEYQPIEFNENRVGGNDATASNLSAVLAYYVYVILGLDGDSFSPRGGDAYFQKAQSIVNNAPDGRDLLGWKPFDGQRNRYWLTENLTNNRYALVHDVLYNYFRQGLDQMYDKETEARVAVMNALNQLNTLNTDIPNTMIVPFFFQGRANELVKMLKKASPDDRSRAVTILSKIDIPNANLYKQELK